MDKSPASEVTIAGVMRQALDQAKWSPDDDPEAVIAALLMLCSAVGSVTTDDADPDDLTVARLMFECKTLADVYLFTGEVQKRVDQQHPAQPPGYAEMPRNEFVNGVVGVLPYFHRRHREVSRALDEAFPRECEDAAGGD
jgi:hypothetical protein